MADNTRIEWCDATWNPVRGCTRVSAGCENCYAERFMARDLPINIVPGGELDDDPERFARMTKDGPRWTRNVALIEAMLERPLQWKKPRRIFVNSMSDLFHERLPNADIRRVYDVMASAPQHTFMILTKRPERMLDAYTTTRQAPPAWLLPNVWLGVSIEDQYTADARIPVLLQVPAVVRFVSAEPLLGPIDLGHYLPRDSDAPGLAQTIGLDWVICGGESGPNARPMDIEWPRKLRDDCIRSGVRFFFKQWGAWIDSDVYGTWKAMRRYKARHLDGMLWEERPEGVSP